jgi:UDP-3-O-[3-hydroxymyristoyl] glucosamine N-acyltransferase
MSIAWKTGALAEALNAKCEGDPERLITGLAALGRAASKDLSFCEGPGSSALESTRAGAVILHEGAAPEGVVVLRVPSPRLAFAKAAALILPRERPSPDVHSTAVVSDTAWVDPSATVDAHVVIGDRAVVKGGAHIMAGTYIGPDVRVGVDTIVFPNATIMAAATIGDRCRIAAGAVIGSDGFGHIPDEPVPTRFPQLRSVIIADDVDIGANTCVDRGALEDTVVARGARLDNLVQIAHGAHVGARSLLAAFAGLAGRARLGKDGLVGGRSSIKEGVIVGAGSRVAAHSGVAKNVGDRMTVAGFPARPHREWLRGLASLRRLSRPDNKDET